MSIHDLIPGDICVGKSFVKFSPYIADPGKGIKSTFTAHKGMVMVSTFLGSVPADEMPDPRKLMEEMGWVDGPMAAQELAKLKAENELLRQGMKGDYDLDAWLEFAGKGSTHPDDIAVDQFATAMKAKMASARAKGRDGWDDQTIGDSFFLQQFASHLTKTNKGNFEDLANLLMFLYLRGVDPARLGNLMQDRDNELVQERIAHNQLKEDTWAMSQLQEARIAERDQLLDQIQLAADGDTWLPDRLYNQIVRIRKPHGPETAEVCKACKGTYIVPLNQKDHEGEYMEGRCPPCTRPF